MVQKQRPFAAKDHMGAALAGCDRLLALAEAG